MDILRPINATHNIVSETGLEGAQSTAQPGFPQGVPLQASRYERLLPSDRGKAAAELLETCVMRGKHTINSQRPMFTASLEAHYPPTGTSDVRVSMDATTAPKGQEQPVAHPQDAPTADASTAAANATATKLQTATSQQSAPAGKMPLPDFPTHSSDQEKIEFITQLFKDHPKATRSELEAKYTFTDPGNPTAKTGPLRFAGGGQGNVIFLAGTPYVIKKDLAGPEGATYNFFNAARDFLQSQSPDFNNPPEGLNKFPPEALQKMHAQREAILAGFPIPQSVVQTGSSQLVVAPNVGYMGDKKLEGCSIEDIKIGSRIVSKKELILHKNPQGFGPAWLRKCVETRLIPQLKGTPDRGFEYVSQSTAGGIRQAMNRLFDGRDSSKIIAEKCKAMTLEQRQSLATQLKHIIDAHEALPVTFVGSSVMIALPNPADRTSMPRACMGDFAHAMFTSEISQDSRKDLAQGTYDKYKENFSHGIQALYNLVSSTLE